MFFFIKEIIGVNNKNNNYTVICYLHIYSLGKTCKYYRGIYITLQKIYAYSELSSLLNCLSYYLSCSFLLYYL